MLRRYFVTSGLSFVASGCGLRVGRSRRPKWAGEYPLQPSRTILKVKTVWPGAAVLSPDGKQIVYCDEHASVLIRGIGPKARPIHLTPGVTTDPASHFEWSPDGGYVIVSGMGPRSDVRCYNIARRAELWRKAGFHRARWSPSDRRVALSSGTTTTIVDGLNGQIRNSIPHEFSGWSPDGSKAVISMKNARNGENRVGIVETVGWKTLGATPGSITAVSCSEWSGDGARVAIGWALGPAPWGPPPRSIGAAIIESPSARFRVALLEYERGTITALAWSPHGILAVAELASEESLKISVALHDAATGDFLADLAPPNEVVHQLLWSQDGRRLVGVSHEHDISTVQAWDSPRL